VPVMPALLSLPNSPKLAAAASSSSRDTCGCNSKATDRPVQQASGPCCLRAEGACAAEGAQQVYPPPGAHVLFFCNRG
jgi:hypothetical protein